MRSPFLLSIFFISLFIPGNAFAVPGPLVSGGIGIIANIWALLALIVGIAAVSTSFLWAKLRLFRTRSPKIFFFLGGLLGIGLILSIGYYIFHGSSGKMEDPIDQARFLLSKRVSGPFFDIPINSLLANVSISKQAALSREDQKLEEEIRFSIGRNNNIVWNRYLTSGKISIDDAFLSAIESGAYEVDLPTIFSNGKLSEAFEIIDLRTPLEYETSARFQESRNLEYRAIMNDEVNFKRGKTYVFVCHDGMADLSRSLIATAYLRNQGYSAYALKTGMRPILERLGVRPANFSKNVPFDTVNPKSPMEENAVLIDPLGALPKMFSEKGYPAGYEIFAFPFYRMARAEYDKKMATIEKFLEQGKPLYFACYDTFSCFYSRVFFEDFFKKFPKSPIKIRVFR